MTILPPALALLAALMATSAAANPQPTDNRDTGQAQQDRSGEASAHGYQNPTGPDPDPRMTEQVGEDLLEEDVEEDDAREDNAHGSEQR